MSWLLSLYETYESNLDQVGIIEKKRNGKEYTLLPISHTTQNAHIEVNITEEGEFHSAKVIDSDDASTLIPCTKDAGGRVGLKDVPYPLHTKLIYAAGDYPIYNQKIKEEPYKYYIVQLKSWAESRYENAKIKSIYTYLCKKKLIEDLLTWKILYLDKNRFLLEKWNKYYEADYGEKPQIFSVIDGEFKNLFLRFNVYSPNKLLTKVWKDKQVYESYIKFYNDSISDEDDLCFVTGKWIPNTDKHPNKIRNNGDKGKLISANDKSGFTFRGRFSKSTEVASISYEVSQKAHNALKWLIHRQGKTIDNRVFLIWGNDQLDIVDAVEDTFSLNPTPIEDRKRISYTNQAFAEEVVKAFDGYKNNLNSKANVSVLVLDSATTGRLAVLYYRNMDKELYLDRLLKWHSTCVWLHRYRKNEEGQFVQFYGAPATKDIAYAVYGLKANEKVIKGLMERMLPCIIDDKKIPQDIIKSAFHRASNPVSMDKWEWEKTLSITCALINKQEGYDVALDTENTDRDYLFGRLLAIADVLERRALGSDETRSSNAIRYMNSFSKHPARTWKTIQESLQPYQARLGAKAFYLSKLIDEVASKMNIEDFNNKPLSGKYLLGFYSQRHELYQKNEKNSEDKVTSNE